MIHASDIIKDLSDGDTLVVASDVEHVINRCCECGTYHHIKIMRGSDGTLRLRWTRLDGDPEIIDPRETIIEKGFLNE